MTTGEFTVSHLRFRGDAALWVFVAATQTLYRVVLIGAFVSGATTGEVWRALWTGLRFDAVIATIVVTPSLIAANALGRFAFASTLRRFWASAYVVCAVSVCVVDFTFFAELKSHVDQRLYLFTVADAGKILHTVWSSQHLVIYLLIAVALVVGGLLLVQRVWGATPSLRRSPIVIAAWCVFYVPAVRGLSVGCSPVRVREASVTSNMTLNHTIPSPPAALWHALEDRSHSLEPVSADKVDRALTALHRSPVGTGTLVERLRRRAPRHEPLVPPRHLVIVLLEGQHGFGLQPAMRGEGVAEGLGRLADEGAYFPNFISAGVQTDNTLAVLVGGLVIPGVNLLHDERATQQWPTALAPQFKALGYRTRFFYGGFVGWCRLDAFVLGQGFDELYGAPDIGRDTNAWGVWDEHLFAFAETRIDDSVPSLDVILTTTNHSPFDLDASRLAPFAELPGRFAGEDQLTRRVLAHERYVDAQVARFARRLNQKVPQAIFAITADHVARAATFDGLSRFEQSVIPFVLWGNGLAPNKRGVFATGGSQLDVFATLFALSADADAEYLTLGNDLFAPPGLPWREWDPAHLDALGILSRRLLLSDGH